MLLVSGAEKDKSTGDSEALRGKLEGHAGGNSGGVKIVGFPNASLDDVAFSETEFRVVFADAGSAAAAKKGLAAKAATRGLTVKFDSSAQGAALAAAGPGTGGAGGAGEQSASAILGANKRARAAVDLDGSLDDYMHSGKKQDDRTGKSGKGNNNNNSGWQQSSSSDNIGGTVTSMGNKLDM